MLYGVASRPNIYFYMLESFTGVICGNGETLPPKYRMDARRVNNITVRFIVGVHLPPGWKQILSPTMAHSQQTHTHGQLCSAYKHNIR